MPYDDSMARGVRARVGRVSLGAQVPCAPGGRADSTTDRRGRCAVALAGPPGSYPRPHSPSAAGGPRTCLPVPTLPPHYIRWADPLPVSMQNSAPRDVSADDQRGAQRRSGCTCRRYRPATGRGPDWRESLAFCSARSRVGTGGWRARSAGESTGAPGSDANPSPADFGVRLHRPPSVERPEARLMVSNRITRLHLQEGHWYFRFPFGPTLISRDAVLQRPHPWR